MKFQELKEKFKNKYVIGILSGVLVIALAGGMISVSYAKTAKNGNTTVVSSENTESAEEESDEEEDGDDEENSLKDILDSKISVEEKDIGKEETVYVIADSTGSTQEIIVSDHLLNPDNKDTLEDSSTLRDITNVKGDESFTQNGNKVVWQAGGNDIYYQGTSDAETPVSQKLTYYLDGKEVTPEELAGKSGKVTIRFDYTNNETVKAKINGKEEEINVPFVAISGMVLDDSFTNIKVENGKVMSDGNNNVVIGYALPGIKDSLKIDESDFSVDIDIPEYVEVTADVEDFSLNMTMTAVMNANNFVGTDGELDLSEIDDMLDTLTDATDQLQDGSSQLAEGVDTLKSKLGDFSSGVGTLKDGVAAYTEGASTLADGINTLKSGVDTLSGNIPALVDGVGQLKSGSASAVSGANSLKDGAAQVSAGVNTAVESVSGISSKLSAGALDFQKQVLITAVSKASESGVTLQLGDIANMSAEQVSQVIAGLNTMLNSDLQALQTGDSSKVTEIIFLENVMGNLNGGSEAFSAVQQSLSGIDASQLAALKDGAAQVASGAASLADGLGTLDSGLGTLQQKAGELTSGVDQLASGASQLADGANTLVANNQALNDGVAELSDGTGAIVDGVGELSDGAHELADGIVTFSEDGIDKLLDSYTGDIEPLLDRIQAVKDAGESYETYTAIAKDVNGSVKFIYKTDAIKAE